MVDIFIISQEKTRCN